MKWLKAVAMQYKGLPREIYIIFFAKVVNNIGCFIYPMLTLILTQKIGISRDKAGLFITLVALLSAPGMLLGGKLVDTIGRKKVLIIFQGFGALILITCGFIKPSMHLAYVMMIAQLMIAAAMPVNDALMADLTTPHNRKEAFSLLYMGNNLGLAIGPLIAGFLYKSYLSWVFIGDAITTLISLSLVSFFIKETIHDTKKEQHDESRSHEKKEEGTVFRVLYKRPVLLSFALIMFMYQFSYAQFGFTLPIQLGELFKQSGARYFGLLACINALVVITFTPFISKITHNFKPVMVIAFGGLLYSIAFGSLGFISIFPMFFISIIIMTLGEISISINLGTYIANHTPVSHRGRMNGMVSMIYGSGFAFGPMVMGKFISVFGIKTGWIFIGVFMIIAASLMLILSRFDYSKVD